MDEKMKTLSGVQTLLKFTYGLIPIVAGADKFTNLLTDWSKYLHPSLVSALPFKAGVFMMIVGVIEIIAGIIVLTKTTIGAYIVSAWLILIALSLLASGNYLDVAVRDVAMAIGAFSLAKLSTLTQQ
ncbi:MAG: hypothetical protein JSU01_10460 [Bacteroidetes bacterium]|nr:hypothetical protein [Bacteroidota bacterium]